MAAATSCLAPSPRLTLAASSRRQAWHRRRPAVHRCAAAVDGRKTTVQSKAGDALEVCRVVNGMWQVSGASWGRAQPAAAVDAMLRYADGGLTTFDMADICKEFQIIVRPRVSRSGCVDQAFRLSAAHLSTLARIHFLIPVHLVVQSDSSQPVFPRGKIQSKQPKAPNSIRGPWASSAFLIPSRPSPWRARTARTNGSPMSSTAARAVPTAAAAPPSLPRRLRPARCTAGAAAAETATAGPTRVTTVSNRGDSLAICRVLNGMWQTSGGWGRIDRDAAVDAMLAYADAGLSTFDMADHYGPAEDLYGMFINRVRRERPPEFLEEIKGLTKWVPPPVKMTRSYVEDNINRSRKRMDVAALDMLQFHWWEYSNPGYLDALKHITDLKEEGKIKTVALTNFDTDRLQIILENGIPVVSNQKYKRMVDAWGGWSLFQTLLQTLKKVSLKHGVSIATVAVRYILNQTSVAGSMVGVRLGLSEHIKDTNAIFSLELDEEDMNSITEVSKKGRNLMDIIGDCGDEYRA